MKVELLVPNAEKVNITKDTLTVDLSDGRTISVPLAWFPSLLHATNQGRKHWKLIGKGQGIHWEVIDEDISVEDCLREDRQEKGKNLSRSGWSSDKPDAGRICER